MKYDGIDEDDIPLILNGKEKVSGWNDTVMTNETDHSVISPIAGVCVHVAKWVHNDQK